MKTLKAKTILATTLLTTVLFVCGNGSLLLAQNYDDVLYTPQKKKTTTSQEPQRYIDSNIHNQSTESTETLNNSYQSTQSTDAGGNTYITNNYNGSYTNYSEDDYYDYAYSARIKRFYSSEVSWGYYDPYFTNSYWYDYNPASWGVSIYVGYNWWYPSYYYYGYAPYWGLNWGWGYPYYYGGSFWSGYYYGYWNGFYAGSYYYNSWDRYSCYYGNPSSYRYGSRTSVGRPTTGYDRDMNGSRSSYNYGKRGGMDYATSRNSRSNVASASRDSRTFGERYESRNPNATRATTYGRNTASGISRDASPNANTRSSAPAYSTPTRRNGIDIDRSSSQRAVAPTASTRNSNNAYSAPTETYRKPVQSIEQRSTTSTPVQRSSSPVNTRQYTPSTNQSTRQYDYTPSRSSNSPSSVSPSRSSETSTPSRSSGSTVSPSRSSTPSTGTPRGGGSSSGGSSGGGSRSSGGSSGGRR